jgi:hypothetical protein
VTLDDRYKPFLDLTVEITPDEATKQAIETGLDAYNLSKAPDSNMQPLWVVARDENGTVQAGLNGVTFWGG